MEHIAIGIFAADLRQNTPCNEQCHRNSDRLVEGGRWVGASGLLAGAGTLSLNNVAIQRGMLFTAASHMVSTS